MFLDELHSFLDFCKDKTAPFVDTECALKSLRFATLAQKSLNQNRKLIFEL